MFNKLWSDLFKGVQPTIETRPEDIADEWMLMEDVDRSELININEHEVLSEEAKERRRKWAKRIEQGRSHRHSQLPSKAQLKQRRKTQSESSSRPAENTTSAASNDQHSQLRAKLKLAVSSANQASTTEPTSSSSLTTRSAKSKRKEGSAAKHTTIRNTRQRVIQQPASRGVN